LVLVLTASDMERLPSHETAVVADEDAFRHLGAKGVTGSPHDFGDERITGFMSVGLATEDLAVAVAYEKALEGRAGREI
jgi:hypothetical protein